MSGRRRPLWLVKWRRRFEVVPFPPLFLWRRFGCTLGQRRECVEGTIAPRVLAPRWRRPHRAASRRVSQALLQPIPVLPGCSPGPQGPRPQAARPREVGADAPGRGRGPAEQQRVRVPRAREGGVVARSGAFSEVQPPGMEPSGVCLGKQGPRAASPSPCAAASRRQSKRSFRRQWRASSAVPGRRQNTIVVKVPGQEDSHNEDGESGSEASDSVSNCGQSGSQNIGNNVTLITLNSEEDYPNGTWLGDENNPEMRVRCAIIPSDMLHISTNCRTAEKMALTLLDYLFHREVQAVSNLSGQGKHGKKQLDPLTIYGIRCHLFYKFGITESDWYRIKQSIDSKCRTAWRRKQRGQSLAVKSFSRRTPSSSSYGASDTMMSTPPPASELQQPPPQALHYALANAQQVQIHQIGEDGQVQVIPQGHLHIAQVPQGEQVQITQDSEGNLQIHHVGQDGQVLQGAQLIAVASSDPAATGVDGSPLQGSDIQVQYVQLAPVTDHTAAAQPNCSDWNLQY
ncbi:protein BANP isoform X3 [Monodon monoceros]|uniref:protein BANP isoform X3 n=1 Tax=Monodon monoceros TaxID=40151 RepID=UPI0010F8FE73|nr:protein BANP isoform X3 [Monodon monoceros]